MTKDVGVFFPEMSKRRITDFFKSVNRNEHDSDDKEQDSAPIVTSEATETTETERVVAEETPLKKKKFEHHFQKRWLADFKWLTFDNETEQMTCTTCLKSGKVNMMTTGCRNFRTSTLKRHAESTDHINALKEDLLRRDMCTASDKSVRQKQDAVIAAMRCLYWMSKEGIATAKYESLLNFCKVQGCESLANLDQGKNATYTSWQSAEEMQKVMADVISEEIDKKLKQSGFVSVMIDESTDIVVAKKLVIYARTVDPETFDYKTFFLGNIRLDACSATAQEIFNNMKTFLQSRGLCVSNIIAFGSDGASTMTGKKGGVATRIKEESPFSINIHCFAHRLALCTEKAAESVGFINKTFQSTLTDMFYYFHKSSKRISELKEIQKLLEHDELKLKEVHQVRWFTFYNALHTVYISWKPLATYFKKLSKPTDKEKQILKSITDTRFISIMHMLMDVIPAFTQLSIIFQKENLDISTVPSVLDSALDCAKRAKEGKSHYQEELKSKIRIQDGKVFYKDVVLSNSDVKSARKQFESDRAEFIDRLENNVNRRFPKDSKEIAFAFKSLGMRPLSFLSQDEMEAYGKEDIDKLVKFYGEEKTDKSGRVVKALVNAESVPQEWTLVKKLVLDQKYPRDSLAELWTIINNYHKELFPNLLTLARVAILTPLQTADCERGFSAQNNLHTTARNCLKPETLNRLMTIMLEGPRIEDFNFTEAVKKWNMTVKRRIFQK